MAGNTNEADLASFLRDLDGGADMFDVMGQPSLTDLGFVCDTPSPDVSATVCAEGTPAVSAAAAASAGAVAQPVGDALLTAKDLTNLSRDEIVQLLSNSNVSVSSSSPSLEQTMAELNSGSEYAGSAAAPGSPYLTSASMMGSPVHPSTGSVASSSTSPPRSMASSANTAGSAAFVPVKSEASTVTVPAPRPTAEAAKAKRMERKRKRGQSSLPAVSAEGISQARLQELQASKVMDPELPETEMDRFDLSPEEERFVKRQRRLIKNRLSAQQSRQRKKEEVDDLTQRLAVAEAHSRELEKELTVSRQENLQLKHQVSHLTSLCQRHGVSINDAVFATTAGVSGAARKLVNPTTTVQKVRTGAVTLCMVVFAFGLLNSADVSTAGLAAGPGQASLPTSTAGGRLLLSVGVDMDEVDNGAQLPTALPSGLSKADVHTVDMGAASVRLIDDDDDPSDDNDMPAFIEHAKRPSHPTTYIFSNDVRSVQPVPEKLMKNATATTTEGSDTSVTVPDAQTCLPGEVVAVVVPADTLNATTVDGSTRYPPGSFVELHAEVLSRQTFHGHPSGHAVDGGSSAAAASSSAAAVAPTDTPSPRAA